MQKSPRRRSSIAGPLPGSVGRGCHDILILLSGRFAYRIIDKTFTEARNGVAVAAKESESAAQG